MIDGMDRLPPQDTDAEASVVAAILSDPNALDKLRGLLEPTDFYRSRNQEIYRAALDCASKRMPTDFVAMTNALRARGTYDEIGGLKYLSDCCGILPTSL